MDLDFAVPAVALLLAVLAPALFFLYRRLRPPRFIRRAIQPPPEKHRFANKKPAWVSAAVIRLKVRMPHEGCRKIAATFNVLYIEKGETVGKTYVAETIKAHAAEILLERRKLKNRLHRQRPRNLTWGMDLTFLSKDHEPALGILDHGTRALLCLRSLHDRTTIGILRVVLDVIAKFGRPRFLRTDNEGVFRSPLFRGALWLLGIRHQRIEAFCPWQNGRIERLFGTLKPRLKLWWARVGAADDAQGDLDIFRTWYNHARPHQHLGRITPAMAWAGVTKADKNSPFFSAWEHILTGVVMRS